MKPSTAALLRVSLDSQTTDPQKLAIARWAAMEGLPEPSWYEEPGVSGISKSRPVRDAMLAACRKGRHDVLVLAALDRLGRNAAEVVNLLAELRELGVRVVSLREGLDFQTTIGQLVASVLAFIAQIERESIVARTKAGQAVARAKGIHCGRTPGVIPDAVLEVVRARLPTEPLSAILPTLDGCWKPVTDRKTGERSQKPWRPSASAVRRRLAKVTEPSASAPA